jgi:hypothetical protein
MMSYFDSSDKGAVAVAVVVVVVVVVVIFVCGYCCGLRMVCNFETTKRFNPGRHWTSSIRYLGMKTFY